MDAKWLVDAPVLMAVVDDSLVCRWASRGWRERLGLTRTGDGFALPLSEMVRLDHTAELAEKLRGGLRRQVSLQDIPKWSVGSPP
jgi:hypothetical protein